MEHTNYSEKHYEIEPRPAALGGGWILHLVSADPEMGSSLEIGGGVWWKPTQLLSRPAKTG
jgi:hypothetical protein